MFVKRNVWRVKNMFKVKLKSAVKGAGNQKYSQYLQKEQLFHSFLLKTQNTNVHILLDGEFSINTWTVLSYHKKTSPP